MDNTLGSTPLNPTGLDTLDGGVTVIGRISVVPPEGSYVSVE